MVQSASIGVILVKLIGKEYEFFVKTFETLNAGKKMHMNEVFYFKSSSSEKDYSIDTGTNFRYFETPSIRATSLYLTFLTLFFILYNVEY